jgi:hypothetical protein
MKMSFILLYYSLTHQLQRISRLQKWAIVQICSAITRSVTVPVLNQSSFVFLIEGKKCMQRRRTSVSGDLISIRPFKDCKAEGCKLDKVTTMWSFIRSTCSQSFPSDIWMTTILCSCNCPSFEPEFFCVPHWRKEMYAKKENICIWRLDNYATFYISFSWQMVGQFQTGKSFLE